MTENSEYDPIPDPEDAEINALFGDVSRLVSDSSSSKDTINQASVLIKKYIAYRRHEERLSEVKRQETHQNLVTDMKAFLNKLRQ